MRKNMLNLAKYAVHVCGIYAAYAAICGIFFFAYFELMQLRVTENHNHDH